MTLKFTLLISILMSNLIAIGAFQCFVCDSKNDNECMEKLPSDTRLVPQDCRNITNAKYCIKTTNLYAGEPGTKRFCASNDHGNYCRYMRQPTGDREYRSCVLTCDSENCNGSPSLIDKQSIFCALVVVTYSFATTLMAGRTSNRT